MLFSQYFFPCFHCSLYIFIQIPQFLLFPKVVKRFSRMFVDTCKVVMPVIFHFQQSITDINQFNANIFFKHFLNITYIICFGKLAGEKFSQSASLQLRILQECLAVSINRNDLNPLAQFSREQRTLEVVGKSCLICFCDRSVLALCLMLFHIDNIQKKPFLL